MDTTDLRPSPVAAAGLAVAALALGTGIGFAAPAVATWLTGLLHRTPLPAPGLLELVADLPWTWSVPAGVVLGVVVAAFLALTIVHEGLRLTVAPDHLEYRQEGREGWIERSDVASIYADGTYAVVLDEKSRLLTRLDADGLNSTTLAQTLREYGYPWREADPFETDYQRWMDGRPGFTAAEHRLIHRWQEVRRKQPERIDADAALREENLVVRYRDGRVEVRRARESNHGTHRRPATS